MAREETKEGLPLEDTPPSPLGGIYLFLFVSRVHTLIFLLFKKKKNKKVKAEDLEIAQKLKKKAKGKQHGGNVDIVITGVDGKTSSKGKQQQEDFFSEELAIAEPVTPMRRGALKSCQSLSAVDSYIAMKKLRQELDIARILVDLCRKRELIKANRIQAMNDIFEFLVANENADMEGAFDGTLSPRHKKAREEEKGTTEKEDRKERKEREPKEKKKRRKTRNKDPSYDDDKENLAIVESTTETRKLSASPSTLSPGTLKPPQQNTFQLRWVSKSHPLLSKSCNIINSFSPFHTQHNDANQFAKKSDTQERKKKVVYQRKKKRATPQISPATSPISDVNSNTNTNGTCICHRHRMQLLTCPSGTTPGQSKKGHFQQSSIFAFFSPTKAKLPGTSSPTTAGEPATTTGQDISQPRRLF